MSKTESDAKARRKKARTARAHRREPEWGVRVVLVDDDALSRRFIARDLARAGMEVIACEDAEEAMAQVRALEPPVVVADLSMPGKDGLSFLKRVREELPRVQRVLVTAHPDVEIVLRASSEAGVIQVVQKPYEPAALRAAIRAALEQHRLLEENVRLKDLVAEQTATLAEVNKSLKSVIRRRERQIVATKARWERTFDAIADPIAVIDASGRVQQANRAYVGLAGREFPAVIGRKCWEVTFARQGPCPGCPVGAGSSDVLFEPHRLELSGRSREAYYEVALFPLIFDEKERAELGLLKAPIPSVVCRYRDIGEERRLRARLLRAERMTAIGELAAGIAHELNNPLGGLLAMTQVLLRDSALEGEDRELLHDIEEAAQRCKRIVDALLRFTRGAKSRRREPIDFAAVVEDALTVARPALKATGALPEVTIEEGLSEIHGSPALLSQALVALLTNAGEALARTAERPATPRVTVRVLAEEDEVWIEVADNGPGIPPEQLGQLFTPFSTSRDTAEGAGLGLPTVHRIIETFKGRVEVFSPPEGGATFRLVLPAARDE